MKLRFYILVSVYSALASADHDTSPNGVLAAPPVSPGVVRIVEEIKADTTFFPNFQAATNESKVAMLKDRYPGTPEGDLNDVISSLSNEPGQPLDNEPFPGPVPEVSPDRYASGAQGVGTQDIPINQQEGNAGGPTEPAPGIGTGPDPGPEQGLPGQDPRNNGQGPEQANNPRRGGGMMGGGSPRDPMSQLAMLAGMAQGFGGQGGGGGGGPPPPPEMPKIAAYRPGAPYVQPPPTAEVPVTPALAQSLALQLESPEQREARANNFNEFLRNYTQGQTLFLQQVVQQGALYLQNIQTGQAAMANQPGYPSLSANVATRVRESVAPRARRPAGISQGLSLTRAAAASPDGQNAGRNLLRPRQRYLR